MITPANKPCTARKRISVSTFHADAHKNDVPKKPASVTIYVRREPNLPHKYPTVGAAIPVARVNAVTAHWITLKSVSNSTISLGKGTTIVDELKIAEKLPKNIAAIISQNVRRPEPVPMTPFPPK